MVARFEGFRLVRYWFRGPDGLTRSLTFPEIAQAVALTPVQADTIRLLAPGESHVERPLQEDGARHTAWSVTRLGGTS